MSSPADTPDLPLRGSGGAPSRGDAGPLAGASAGVRGASALAVRYQPILDVVRGVAAGYQAQVVSSGSAVDISRLWPLSNDVDGHLTAAALRTALTAAVTLPANTFLTVPVPVEVVAQEVVRRALLGGRPGGSGGTRPLSGVVLDLVGPIDFANRDDLLTAVAPLCAAGARISVGGYGAPQPELSSILSLRPSVIRLGRDWVRAIDTSSAKRSALEAIGSMADQLDAWILVEGVSTQEELRALVDLRVPLAQGSFIGEPQSVWPGIAQSVRAELPAVPAETDGTLRGLVQPARTASDPAALTAALPATSGVGVVVVVGDDGRPTTVIEQDDHERWCAWEAMTVNVDTPVGDVVMRALTRPRSSRFAPVVCTNGAGHTLGVLRMERMISALAQDARRAGGERQG